MTQRDNVVIVKHEKPLLDKNGKIDAALDEISRHFLLSYANDIQKYGVVDMDGALALIRDGVLKFDEWHGEVYLKPFTVIRMTPEYVKSYALHFEELEFIPIINESDPYLRSFEEDAPNDYRFDAVYFMTEQRLKDELENGNRERLLYKTPYRPELGDDMMKLAMQFS